jgi:hypothetical protein
MHIQKSIVFVLLLISLGTLSAIIDETGSFRNFIYGQEPACQYDNWVSHLAEKVISPGYNVYSPWDRQTTGFGNFHIPTTAELATWGTIMDEFLSGQWRNVDTLLVLSGFPYQLVRFTDTDTDRIYYMLREIPDASYDDNGTPDTYDDEDGAFSWGWGLYLYNPSGDNRTIITIPHPCDDFVTPALGVKALEAWNAEFLMIAGAGREVAWTGVPPWANNKSLSDPTRTANHPWYPAYTKMCNKIRTDTGRREFSAQLHTYDSSLHQGFSSVQISAGYNKMCPNLPIRDLSRFRNDLINSSNFLMIPQNTLGSNSDVYINDYYTVQYSIHEFTYDNNGELITINDIMDLPAYSQNVQMNYTLQNWTDYDVYEPFFHVEMDELPNCYSQNDNSYKWFYNWNPQTQHWNMDRLFDRALDYYSIWINTMTDVLTGTLNMNDGSAPIPPSDLALFNQSFDYITLHWQKADDYDFDTYEILYSTQPIDNGGYSVYSRTNQVYLSSPHCEAIDVTGLANSTQYYFKIRAKDKNGNYSTMSNQVIGYTIPVKITNYKAIGQDLQVTLKWNVVNQQNNQGFKVYRSQNGVDFTLMDDYINNPFLIGGSSFYQWTDNSVENDLVYIYKISCVSNTDMEFFHNVTVTGYPRDYYTIYVGTEDQTIIDSLSFSANPSASSGNDSDYDVVKSPAPLSNYVYGAFWEQYWGNYGTYLQQEVMADFVPEETVRTWAIRIKSDQLNTPLTIRIDDSFTRYSEKLYLRDNSTGAMIDLETGIYSFMVTDNNYKSFTLYWGNLQPTISISSLPNRVYQGNSTQTFYWGANYSFLVDHYNVYIKNDTDSLLLAANLPNTITSHTYTFLSDVNYPNCKFYVDAWGTDGQIIRQVSGYTFGIVPSTVYYGFEPGLIMKSNVFPGSVLTTPDVFGAGAVGWTMDSNSAWWQIDPFSYGFGYWVNKVNPFEYSSTSTIQRDSTSFVIRQGWNIIPNPHLCTYQVKDLRFRINTTSYSFAEFMDQHLVSPAVFVYRNNQYIQTDTIYPQESFLLKYYGNPSLLTSIVFIPYNSGPSLAQGLPEWKLKLSAEQTDCDSDDLTIGSHVRSSDGYELVFDVPEPPAKPVSNLIRLYITKSHSETSFLDWHLNTEFKSVFSTDVEEEKIWDFRLETGNANPVNFNVDTTSFPLNYGASIHIGDWEYDIQHGNTFVFNPGQSGVFNGQIVVHNYFTSNQDNIAPSLLSKINIYPNPFNLIANIAFDLSKASQVSVSIYNIKGQLVKVLQEGLLKKGHNNLIWDGTDDNNSAIGSGVYFARIKTDKGTSLHKLLFVK